MRRGDFRVRGAWGWWGALCCIFAAVLLSWTPHVYTAPERAPGASTAVGSVSGTVRLVTAAPAPPAMLSPYARSRYRPPARPESSPGSPETVVVFLRTTGTQPESPRRPVSVVQRNRTIIPHVTAVRVGTSIDFPNQDDVFHNLFSLSATERFNLGRYPPGESRSQLFDRAGLVRLFCDIHSEMGAVIVVLDTPYFTQPDADGGYTIAGVPAGEYTLVAGHDVAGSDSTRVVVRDGQVTAVDFTLGQ